MAILRTHSYFALFVAVLVYGSGSGSKCPHDLFTDLKGWYLESLHKLQASSRTGDDMQIRGKGAIPLNCITLMNRKGVSSKTDILDGADDACRQLPNGRIYGDVDVAGLKAEGSRILVGIKIVRLEHKPSSASNILDGTAVIYPNLREITFSFEKKDSGEIHEVGVVLRIKRPMMETLFNNPTTPVCIIRVEESTETTPCTLFNSYTSMLCQSSALVNCSGGADTFDKGCTCKAGFTGRLCAEKEKVEVLWYQNQTILEYIGLGAAGLFLLGSILVAYCRINFPHRFNEDTERLQILRWSSVCVGVCIYASAAKAFYCLPLLASSNQICVRKRRRSHSSSAYSGYSTYSPTSGYSQTRSGTTGTSRSRVPASTAPSRTSRKPRGTTAYDTDTGATLKQFPTIVPGTKLVINKSKSNKQIFLTLNILISLTTLRVSAQCWHNLFRKGIRGFNVSEQTCLTVLEVPGEEGNLYEQAVRLCEKEIPGGRPYDSKQLPEWEQYVLLNKNETVFFNLMLTQVVKRHDIDNNIIAFSAIYGNGNAMVIPYFKSHIVWSPRTGRTTYLSNEDIEMMFNLPDDWLFLNPVCITWRVGENTTSFSQCNQKANVSYIICQNEPFRGCKPKSENFSDGCTACPSRRTGKYCQYEGKTLRLLYFEEQNSSTVEIQFTTQRIKVKREEKEQSYTNATVLLSVLILVLVLVAIKTILYFRKKMRNKDDDIKSPGPYTGSPREEKDEKKSYLLSKN
ncbi:LOW QUALITY PROTEIN: hypothetical protein M514_00212 [Trichuris suis]|uniref:EGF-like domain-containing protein n=1 Tax=Trichuris suis TaxID=68888 RepID=A0A085NUE3_9BILA|nr:LOW QUALITY PROTEIN: hypothetical protein M514_00212 [Trichuris suis]